MARISPARKTKGAPCLVLEHLTGQKGTERKQNQSFPLILTQGGTDGKRQVRRSQSWDKLTGS